MNLPTYRPAHLPEVAQEFWSALEHGVLKMSRCSMCHTWLWYPDDVGPCCAGASVEWAEVTPTGTVYTFTTVRRAFLPDGASAVPFTVALIELDGVEGVRLVANLEDREWSIGDRVQLDVVENDGVRQPVFRACAATA
jgi:uncharacterized protein